jgi:hypothetical protein
MEGKSSLRNKSNSECKEGKGRVNATLLFFVAIRSSEKQESRILLSKWIKMEQNNLSAGTLFWVLGGLFYESYADLIST